MSTAAEIIDALHKAGATLVIEHGRAHVRGQQISPELIESLKANRAAVIEEWQRRTENRRGRYAEVPDADTPLLGRGVKLSRAQRLVVVAYVFRQPRPVHAWVMGRINDYHAMGLQPGDDEAAACVDVLCWQCNNSPKAAIAWLEGINACAIDWKQNEKEASPQ